MNLSFVAEVWDLLNYYVDSNDRSAAATTLVDFLVDNNYDAEEIKAAFVGERDIIRALEAYDDEYDEDDEDDDIYDDDEDNDW
jgi:hypothetical protein